MSFRKKNTKYNHTIMIKRAIEADKSLREWIFRNSNYRRKVWNDFVEEYYRCKEVNEQFDVMKFKEKYFYEIETPNREYDTHVIGISEQVMKDVMSGLKIAKSNHGKLKFRKFDRFRCSFGVHAKPTFRKLKEMPPRFNSRVYISDTDQITFRTHGGKFLDIKLKEPLFYDTRVIDDTVFYIDKNKYYAFSQEDIKTISFMHELGKFYVYLSIDVINIYDKKTRESHKRRDAAGIDLGIHNPICISDFGDNHVIRMSEKELRRIHYLERRIFRLNHINSKKQYMSKNYIKVLRKIRVSWRKIVNIRKHWRRNVSKQLALSYKKVCVDTFKTPGKEEHIGIPRKLVKKINAFNRMHGMYDMSQSLIHACWKYGTKYEHSPDDSTRTCSRCGHINPHLELSQRSFRCEECGYEIDRDINAAQNCYDYVS